MDEDEILFDQAATDAVAAQALELPDALEGVERRLLLTRLVLAWAQKLSPQHPGEAPLIADHPATALALAEVVS